MFICIDQTKSSESTYPFKGGNDDGSCESVFTLNNKKTESPKRHIMATNALMRLMIEH